MEQLVRLRRVSSCLYIHIYIGLIMSAIELSIKQPSFPRKIGPLLLLGSVIEPAIAQAPHSGYGGCAFGQAVAGTAGGTWEQLGAECLLFKRHLEPCCSPARCVRNTSFCCMSVQHPNTTWPSTVACAQQLTALHGRRAAEVVRINERGAGLCGFDVGVHLCVYI